MRCSWLGRSCDTSLKLKTQIGPEFSEHIYISIYCWASQEIISDVFDLHMCKITFCSGCTLPAQPGSIVELPPWSYHHLDFNIVSCDEDIFLILSNCQMNIIKGLKWHRKLKRRPKTNINGLPVELSQFLSTQLASQSSFQG